MITVVLWYWGNKYTPDHVNKTASMVGRHLRLPHRVICLTDSPTNIDPSIECRDLPPMPDYINSNRHLRRLWIFSNEAKELGDNLLQLDIDCIITGDITHLVAPKVTSPICIWKAGSLGSLPFALNPTFLWLKAGVHSGLWDKIRSNPERLFADAQKAHCVGSDQAICTYHFTNQDPHNRLNRIPWIETWDSSDGILGLTVDLQHGKKPLPPHTRIVSFHGRWDPAQCTSWPWVVEHWR